MIIDDLLALSVGASIGIRERQNEELRQQGVRPTWLQSHPVLYSLLPIIIGLVIGPFVFLGLIAGLVGWGVFVNNHIDNNTHLWLWVAAYLAPFWALWWSIRHLRRWMHRKRPVGTSLVSVRRVP